jgi:hypothetical protein
MIITAPPYDSTAPNCSLDIIDNNLYCFTFHTSTRAAVDAFVANLDWVYAQSVETSEPFNCLVDGSKAGVVPPITYLMRGVRTVVGKYPLRPSNKMAIVMNNSYVGLVQTFLNLVPSQNPVHFFHTKEDALAWLRE